jgi:hypothetical protein
MLEKAGEPNTMSWVVGSFGYMAPGKDPLLVLVPVDFTLILSDYVQ